MLKAGVIVEENGLFYTSLKRYPETFVSQVTVRIIVRNNIADNVMAILYELGGLHFSTLIAHMPTESSSKAAGKPNGIYPIRELYMKKSDMNAVLDWV